LLTSLSYRLPRCQGLLIPLRKRARYASFLLPLTSKNVYYSGV